MDYVGEEGERRGVEGGEVEGRGSGVTGGEGGSEGGSGVKGGECTSCRFQQSFSHIMAVCHCDNEPNAQLKNIYILCFLLWQIAHIVMITYILRR